MPPPQREPNERERELAERHHGVREGADHRRDDGWLDRIAGLRNIVVDAEALWETAAGRREGRRRLVEHPGSVCVVLNQVFAAARSAAVYAGPRDCG